MLVLSRKLGEQILVGDNIRVTIVAISANSVRLGFTAPVDVPIKREELCSSVGHCNPLVRRSATYEVES
jgi:carbon storage regulator